MLLRDAGPGDAAGIARVHVESWRTTYRGIVPDAYLDSLSREHREEVWSGMLSAPEEGSFTLVAEDQDGEIIGFASAGPERSGDPIYRGELYAIYLLEGHQQRGLGRQLTRAVVRRLADRGLCSMLVWVLADNPSRAFYECLGGVVVRTQPTEIGGLSLEEVAYGWGDTGPLLD